MLALLSLILSTIKLIGGLLLSLFVMIVESALYGLFVWLIYVNVRNKLGLPELNYYDISYIVLAIKLVLFSSFNMIKAGSHFEQNPAEDEEKTSDS